MKLSLGVMTPGKWMGKLIPIRLSPFVIGRAPQCHLQPASAKISQRHCALFMSGEVVLLRDFHSAIGTLVNGKPVNGDVELQDHDCLKIGPVEFRVHIDRRATNDEDDEAAAELLLGGKDSRPVQDQRFVEDQHPDDSEILTEKTALEPEETPSTSTFALAPPRKPLPAPPLNVKIGEVGDILIITITSSEMLEARPIRNLRMYLMLLADGGAYPHYVLSLNAVESMDSSFLGSIVELDQKLKNAGGKLAICQLRPETSEIIQNLGLGQSLAIYKNEVEAIKALSL